MADPQEGSDIGCVYRQSQNTNIFRSGALLVCAVANHCRGRGLLYTLRLKYPFLVYTVPSDFKKYIIKIRFSFTDAGDCNDEDSSKVNKVRRRRQYNV